MFKYIAPLLMALALAACGGSDARDPLPQSTAAAIVTEAPPPTATVVVPSPTSTASPRSEATQGPAPTETPTAGPTTTPRATASAVATPTTAPDATATPTVPPSPVTATAGPTTTLAERLADEAMELLRILTQDVSPRASATQQERDAAEFLAARFEALGYQTELQPFTVDVELSEVSVGPAPLEPRSFPMNLSATGTVSGLLVDAGGAFPQDIPAEGLASSIAVIERGTLYFEEKVTRVAEAGAVAAIVYNNRPGGFRGTLADRAPIPAVSVSGDSGRAILELMAQGDVEATVTVIIETRDSQNVVAEKTGTGSSGEIVVLGGHYDTVPDIPGANDNGSGTATLMTVAKEASERDYPFTLRFIAFGSEELGLLGSKFHADSLDDRERESIVAMLNFDALGTGDVVGLLGDFDLVTSLLDYGQANSIEAERRPSVGRGASSDHASFQRIGVPVVFFLADDFSRIHTPEDRLEFVQAELLGNSAALALGLLGELPPR